MVEAAFCSIQVSINVSADSSLSLQNASKADKNSICAHRPESLTIIIRGQSDSAAATPGEKYPLARHFCQAGVNATKQVSSMRTFKPARWVLGHASPALIRPGRGPDPVESSHVAWAWAQRITVRAQQSSQCLPYIPLCTHILDGFSAIRLERLHAACY